MRTTNKSLRREIEPLFNPSGLDQHRLKIAAVRQIPIAEISDTAWKIQTGSNWRHAEVYLLLQMGFSLFVGDDFLQRCRYAAHFRGERLTVTTIEERWDEEISYSGDIPESVLDKVGLLDSLDTHGHRFDYTGGMTLTQRSPELEYLVVSTSPLPVTTFQRTDPFLLAFRRKSVRPMIEVSPKGKIIEIEETLGKYGFLIVGMWDLEGEVF